MILLQHRVVIAKCVDYYKFRQKNNPGGYYLPEQKIEEPVTSVKWKTWLRSKSRSEVLFSHAVISEAICLRCELIKGALQNLNTSTFTKKQHIFNHKINFRWLLTSSFVLSDSHGVMNMNAQ